MSPATAQDPSKQAIWEVESTHPNLVEGVEKALREVIDPEIGLNIVELGLVRNVAIDAEVDKANVTMIMTTPFCPYAPALLEMARTKTEEAL
ncbi:MAG: iron-sulfur cluster assembly protein, partial [Anaerolineae bacterium]|nr:iron-sulfur cluster assembly protein [Anaerolineae bacterium]